MSFRTTARRLARLPIIGPAVIAGVKLRIGFSFARNPTRQFAAWFIGSREYTNFTYNLTELNRRHLASFVTQVVDINPSKALEYMEELDQDSQLREHIKRRIAASDEKRFADLEPRFARRLGWYAIVRALKPRIIVETGVDKGLGACVLTSALLRNSQEGRPGYYYGTDINQHAGYLLGDAYATCGKIILGDSIESLGAMDELIDLFIHDSDHSAEYEAQEYSAIENKLSESAIVLSDNAHVTDELLRFAERTNRQFLFFKEQPADHWYPGAGIGAAFRQHR